MTWAERVTQAWENPSLNWDLAKRVERTAKRKCCAWLSRNRWDIYWTQTFRGRHSENAAERRWQHFLAASSLDLILKAHMWAVERHVSTPSHHVHALLSMKSRTCLTAFWRDWRRWKERAWATMGKALILRTSETAPIWYLLKYVLKTTNSSPTVPSQENLWGIWTNECPESSLLSDQMERAYAEDACRRSSQ